MVWKDSARGDECACVQDREPEGLPEGQKRTLTFFPFFPFFALLACDALLFAAFDAAPEDPASLSPPSTVALSSAASSARAAAPGFLQVPGLIL